MRTFLSPKEGCLKDEKFTLAVVELRESPINEMS